MIVCFIRYNIVQIVAYVVDFACFFAMNQLCGLTLTISNVTGKALAGAFAFVAHRYFTFQPSKLGVTHEFIRYVSLLMFNTGFSSVLLNIFSLYLSPVNAKVLADVASVAISFVLVGTIVFPKEQEAKIDEYK